MINNNVQKFNFYCHKIIPLSYDNSLSYYEAICKLTKKVNELIKIINDQNELIISLNNDVAALEDKVYGRSAVDGNKN